MKTIVWLSTCVLLILFVLPVSKAQSNSTQGGNATQSGGISSLFNFANDFMNIFDGERDRETAQPLFSANMSGFINAVAETPAVSQIRESWAEAKDSVSSMANQVWQSFITNNSSVSRRNIREAARKLRVNTRT